MLGNVLFVFALKEIVEDISDIYHDTIKDGFLNQVAEYGCVQSHLRYLDKAICFVNVNLPSGRKKWNKRIEALERIHTQSF